MSVNYIAPRDPNEERRLEKIKEALAEVLRPYISGKNKDDKLTKAVDESVSAIKIHLKLKKAPSKGATVMTEAAAHRNKGGNFTKGPSNL